MSEGERTGRRLDDILVFVVYSCPSGFPSDSSPRSEAGEVEVGVWSSL